MAQAVLQRLGGDRGPALGLVVLAHHLVEVAEGHVVQRPQQFVLLAARLHQDDEGHLLLAVQRGDELHVGVGERLFDHQYRLEHVSPFQTPAPGPRLRIPYCPAEAFRTLLTRHTGHAEEVPEESGITVRRSWGRRTQVTGEEESFLLDQ